MNEKTFPISRSKTGLPVLSESGGGCTNTGSAQIICNEEGEALKPLFIPRGLFNGEHAYFVIKPKMFVVEYSRDRNGYSVNIWQIKEVLQDRVLTTLAFEEENGDGNIPEFLRKAVKAAEEKAYDYHCRSPYYILK